jgi:hypothetical protein
MGPGGIDLVSVPVPKGYRFSARSQAVPCACCIDFSPLRTVIIQANVTPPVESSLWLTLLPIVRYTHSDTYCRARLL